MEIQAPLDAGAGVRPSQTRTPGKGRPGSSLDLGDPLVVATAIGWRGLDALYQRVSDDGALFFIQLECLLEDLLGGHEVRIAQASQRRPTCVLRVTAPPRSTAHPQR